jgi:hypothetical protein
MSAFYDDVTNVCEVYSDYRLLYIGYLCSIGDYIIRLLTYAVSHTFKSDKFSFLFFDKK